MDGEEKSFQSNGPIIAFAGCVHLTATNEQNIKCELPTGKVHTPDKRGVFTSMFLFSFVLNYWICNREADRHLVHQTVTRSFFFLSGDVPDVAVNIECVLPELRKA